MWTEADLKHNFSSITLHLNSSPTLFLGENKQTETSLTETHLLESSILRYGVLKAAAVCQGKRRGTEKKE